MNEREMIKKLFGKSIPTLDELQKDGVQESRQKAIEYREDTGEMADRSTREIIAEEIAGKMANKLSNADVLVLDGEHDSLVDVEVELDFGTDETVCARTVLRMAIQKTIKDHILEETKDE